MSFYLEKISDLVQFEARVIQDTFQNSTNKGTGFEIIIRTFISRYSESNFIITHGEIIDTFKHQSGQIDLAILQDSHPKGYNDGRPNILFYDLLLALGEIKMYLNATEMAKVVRNSNELSEFKRHPENNNMEINKYYDASNGQDKSPPYFLISLNTDIAHKTIVSKIEKSNITLMLSLTSQTGKGIVCLGKTHRSIDSINFLDSIGKRIQDYIWESENPLIAFIWAVNSFKVPMINLTNMIPNYYE